MEKLTGFNPFDLHGRVIIVTGGGAGIGRVYCERLASAGARVVVADIDTDAARDCVRTIGDAKGDALASGCDISDAGAVKAMVDATVAHFGRVDGLVNNAALMSSLPRGAWHEITERDWDRVMAVNTRGLFLCCREVWQHMKRQGGGKIVNISSNRVFDGTPNRLHYSTSKAGVIGFTRSLAREVGPDNICVNAVAPGFFLTDQNRTLLTTTDGSLTDRGNTIIEHTPMGRFGTPEDLIGTLLWLCGNGSKFVTGVVVPIDGGFSAFSGV